MRPGTKHIDIYNKREDLTTTITVRELGDNLFKMEDHLGFDFRVTIGDVFKTRLNKEGKYEIMKVLIEADYVNRVFLLASFHEAEIYRPISDEIMRQGGYLEVKWGKAVEFYLPKNSQFDPTDLLRTYNLEAIELEESNAVD